MVEVSTREKSQTAEVPKTWQEILARGQARLDDIRERNKNFRDDPSLAPDDGSRQSLLNEREKLEAMLGCSGTNSGRILRGKLGQIDEKLREMDLATRNRAEKELRGVQRGARALKDLKEYFEQVDQAQSRTKETQEEVKRKRELIGALEDVLWLAGPQPGFEAQEEVLNLRGEIRGERGKLREEEEEAKEAQVEAERLVLEKLAQEKSSQRCPRANETEAAKVVKETVQELMQYLRNSREEGLRKKMEDVWEKAMEGIPVPEPKARDGMPPAETRSKSGQEDVRRKMEDVWEKAMEGIPVPEPGTQSGEQTAGTRSRADQTGEPVVTEGPGGSEGVSRAGSTLSVSGEIIAPFEANQPENDQSIPAGAQIVDGAAREVLEPARSLSSNEPNSRAQIDSESSVNTGPTISPEDFGLEAQKRARLDELEKKRSRGQLGWYRGPHNELSEEDVKGEWDELIRLRRELAPNNQEGIFRRLGNSLARAASAWWRSVSPQGRNKIAWGIGVGVGVLEGALFQEYLPGASVIKGIANVAVFNGISLAIDRVYTQPVRELRARIAQAGETGNGEQRQEFEAELERLEGEHARFKALAADCAAGVAAGSIIYSVGRILYSGVEAAIHASQTHGEAVQVSHPSSSAETPSHVTTSQPAASSSPVTTEVSPATPNPSISMGESIVKVAERSVEDYLNQKFMIPITPDATGTFWAALREGGQIPGSDWLSPYGVSKAEVIYDMIVKLARHNGHNLIMLDGKEFYLRDLLTPEQMALLIQTIKTENFAQYVKLILPVLKNMLIK